MPKFRVPFKGAVLVEVDSAAQADIDAGAWCASVLQLTHGVEPQPVMRVSATWLKLEEEAIEEITAQMEHAKERYEKEHDPNAVLLAESLTDYLLGDQKYFEFYEQECRGGQPGA